MSKLRFAIDVIPEVDGKGFYVVVPSLPRCFSQGKTIQEAIKNSREAVSLHVRAHKKEGESVPKAENALHTVIEILKQAGLEWL